jgi:hypothetical protein
LPGRPGCRARRRRGRGRLADHRSLAPDIHERKLTGVLLRLVADPEPEVAVPAICRLARDFGPDAPEELRKAIAARAVNPLPGVRSAVAEAMESMRRR